MTSSKEKQGHIGDIHQKTLPELRELLERQEKLLQKKKFLQTLPDKGIKVKPFAEKLRKLITEREKLDTKTPQRESASKNLCQVPLHKEDRDVVELRGDNPSGTDATDSLSACLERVSISQSQTEIRGDNKFVNSYERVIKTANEKPAKRVFKPNSSLNISKLQDLPEAYRFRSTHNKPKDDTDTKVQAEAHGDMDTSSIVRDVSKDKVSRVQEESAVHIPDYKYDKTVLISIEESVKLVEDQRKKHEDLQTRQAAERLASRLHVQMEDYNPEGTNMNYRVSAPDTDSDDEPELDGYDD